MRAGNMPAATRPSSAPWLCPTHNTRSASEAAAARKRSQGLRKARGVYPRAQPRAPTFVAAADVRTCFWQFAGRPASELTLAHFASHLPELHARAGLLPDPLQWTEGGAA